MLYSIEYKVSWRTTGAIVDDMEQHASSTPQATCQRLPSEIAQISA